MASSLSLPAPKNPLARMTYKHAFCPYVDVLLWPTPNLADVLKCTQADRLTLAFVTANGDKPSWGGVQPADWPELMAMVKDITPARCVCAFGGANGQELAQTITDVPTLYRAYRSIIDLYRFDTIEFDIEGAATEDALSVMRRNSAIQLLNQALPNLKINYCLPVMPAGLVASGLAILRDAAGRGCKLHNINVMAMDYGQGVRDMGAAAIAAAKSTKTQIDGLKLNVSGGIGLIPMIGQNDTGECFTLTDAQHVADWSAQTPWLTCLSMWSCARDMGKKGALYMSSNIDQKPYAFSSLMARR